MWHHLKASKEPLISNSKIGQFSFLYVPARSPQLCTEPICFHKSRVYLFSIKKNYCSIHFPVDISMWPTARAKDWFCHHQRQKIKLQGNKMHNKKQDKSRFYLLFIKTKCEVGYCSYVANMNANCVKVLPSTSKESDNASSAMSSAMHRDTEGTISVDKGPKVWTLVTYLIDVITVAPSNVPNVPEISFTNS